jgi:hypothetical protein
MAMAAQQRRWVGVLPVNGDGGAAMGWQWWRRRRMSYFVFSYLVYTFST